MQLAKLLPALLGSFIATQAQSAQEPLPPILNFYPDCEYRVLDTQHLSRDTQVTRDSPIAKREAMLINKLLLSLREKAAQAGANAVILTGKKAHVVKDKITSVHNKGDYLRVEFSAQLIHDCQPGQEGRKATEVSASGHLQNALTGGYSRTVNYSKTLSLGDIDYQNRSDRPDVNSTEVSLERGAFGVRLGMSFSDVVAVFGTPSLDYQPSKGTRVVSYGRDLWLQFNQGQLGEVTSENRWFSMELINLIPRDDRFDNTWEIDGKLAPGSFASALAKHWGIIGKTRFTRSSAAETLTLSYDALHNQDSKPPLLSLRSYRYTNTAPVHEQAMVFASSASVSKRISASLNRFNRGELSAVYEDWDLPSIARLRIDADTYFDIVSPHLMARVEDGQITQLRVLDKLVLEASPEPWAIANWKYGQKFEAIEANLDDYFSTGDVIEISAPKLTTSLFFFEQNGQRKLYGATFDFY